MKNKDIYRELGAVDDKFIVEADPMSVRKGRKRRKLAIFAACISAVLLGLNLWLFLPFSGELEDLSKYSDSEYYELMLKVQELACVPDNHRFDNNYEKYFGPRLESANGGVITTGSVMPETPADMYEEVTDNQFEGIIEADLFKRSSEAIFYLDPSTLTLYSYSIEGEDSVLLDSFEVTEAIGVPIYNLYYYNSILYLSPDCRSVTVILPAYQRTIVVSVDVSNPAEMSKGSSFEMSGGYITSRMIEGKLLMVTGFGIERNPDFSDKSTFLPQITWECETHSIAADDIVYTEDAWRAFYTVMATLDTSTLEVIDSAAVLDYAGTVTVSENHIFLSCYHSERSERQGENEGDTLYKIVDRSTIYAVSHSGGKLENIGNVKVDGTPTDQYAMDEYEGMLRVVTETFMRESVHKESDGYYISGTTIADLESADLYCIDLETFEIIGSVIAFSPDEEEVTSVRFEGDTAYVCTAETRYHKDPVYFFDLSDPANITYSDTGVIDGYSTSLVDMGNGKLLGIGYGDSNQVLKVEIYEERGDKVVSVCSFVRKFVVFSEDYKSYYINRAEGLVGLMVSNEYLSEYLLLRFDGDGITQIAMQMFPHVITEDWTRATVIDSTLYIFAEDEFKAVQLEQ